MSTEIAKPSEHGRHQGFQRNRIFIHAIIPNDRTMIAQRGSQHIAVEK